MQLHYDAIIQKKIKLITFIFVRKIKFTKWQ